MGGAPFKISDQNLGLPGYRTMCCTESTNVNALVRSCRLYDLTFDANGGALAIGGNVVFTSIFLCMLDLVLSEFPKTARTEEESTIMGDQSIFFANIAATAYGAFPILPLRSGFVPRIQSPPIS